MSDFNIPRMKSTLSRVDVQEVQSQSEHDDKSQISNNLGAMKKQLQQQDKSMEVKYDKTDKVDKKGSKKDGDKNAKEGKDSIKKSRYSFFSKSGDKKTKRTSMVDEDAIVKKTRRTPKGSDRLKPPLPNQTQQDKSQSPRKSIQSQ